MEESAAFCKQEQRRKSAADFLDLAVSKDGQKAFVLLLPNSRNYYGEFFLCAVNWPNGTFHGSVTTWTFRKLMLSMQICT